MLFSNHKKSGVVVTAPSQYVNGFRLSHAARMLGQTDQSVTRVLERAGFLTRSNFYREFERVYQQSPVEYRKQGKAKL